MESYDQLAAYYDELMDDVDYPAWADYVTDIFERLGVRPAKILDTACGTGNITIPLAQKGYNIWGLDISSEMLAFAENKARKARQKIRFLNQDMRHMSVNESFDCVLSMCDGVNYLLTESELSEYFASVLNCLNENGIFIFDISSYHKLRQILGNNTLYQVKNNIHYIWNNSFDEAKDIVEMELVFFIPEAALYRKFEEYHTQKAYKREYLFKMLRKSGFGKVYAFDAFRFEEPCGESERIFFAALK